METSPEASLSSGHDSAGLHNVRRHRNKKSDPFLELPNDLDIAVQPTPGGPKGENGDIDKGNSLVADLVLAPLNMVTFIFSLFLVDRRQRQWRLSQRASQSTPFWLPFDPEPYQNSSTSAWCHADSGKPQLGSPPRKTGAFRGWYARKHKRSIAKLQISDAFEMRGRVLVALVAWTVLGSLAFYHAIQQVYKWTLA